MAKKHPNWSESDLDQLRQLWRVGLTARVIAERIGRTKYAVLQQVHRSGFQRGPGVHSFRAMYCDNIGSSYRDALPPEQ